MKRYYTYILTLLILVLFSSCEKVVELDLEDAEQMTVIEGIIHDSISDNFVLLSKSRPFNDNQGSFEAISGASVVISDNMGNNFTLSEVEPGKYNNATLKGEQGRIYQLNVSINGILFTAISTMPSRVELDSLSYEEVNNPFGGNEEDITYRVFTHFRDPVNQQNFYRVKAYNGAVQEKGFISLKDDLFNGDDVDFPLFLSEFEANDTAIVQLLAVDEVNYRYFNAIESSQIGEVPGNPESNLVGKNVVGYFGAYAKSEKIITILPK